MYSAPPCHSPSHVAVPDRDCRGGFLAACCLRRLPEARARATHRARRSPIRSSALLHAPIGTRTKALSAAADGSGIDFGMYARCPDAGLLRLLARERECRPADELMTPACTASTSAPSVNQAALMTHLQCSATRAAAVARRRLAQRAWEPHLRHRRSERVRARQMRDNATANRARHSPAPHNAHVMQRRRWARFFCRARERTTNPAHPSEAPAAAPYRSRGALPRPGTGPAALSREQGAQRAWRRNSPIGRSDSVSARTTRRRTNGIGASSRTDPSHAHATQR